MGEEADFGNKVRPFELLEEAKVNSFDVVRPAPVVSAAAVEGDLKNACLGEIESRCSRWD